MYTYAVKATSEISAGSVVLATVFSIASLFLAFGILRVSSNLLRTCEDTCQYNTSTVTIIFARSRPVAEPKCKGLTHIRLSLHILVGKFYQFLINRTFNSSGVRLNYLLCIRWRSTSRRDTFQVYSQRFCGFPRALHPPWISPGSLTVCVYVCTRWASRA